MSKYENRPSKPRDAASIIIYKKKKNKYYVLMGRRSIKSKFMPSIYVFPGGSVDKIVDTLEETIKEKLKIRSQISLYQFLECFKHFCPHGRKGIRLHEIRDFFMMMGISVNESQIP